MDQEVVKLLHILEDISLTKLIVFDVHQEDLSWLRVGRNLHKTIRGTIKCNYDSPFGYYQRKLENYFYMNLIKCWTCNLTAGKKGYLTAWDQGCWNHK